MLKQISLIFFLACTTLLLLATKCDDCDGCLNGECIEFGCLCDPGYLGYACEFDGRVRLPGEYVGNTQYYRDGELVQQDTGYVAEVRLVEVTGNDYYLVNYGGSGDTLDFSVLDGQVRLEPQAFAPGTISGTGQVRIEDGGEIIFLSLQCERGTETWTTDGSLSK